MTSPTTPPTEPELAGSPEIAVGLADARARDVHSPHARHVAELLALLVMLTWGGNVVAVKAAIADVPPILFACVRFLSAFLVLLVVLKLREGNVGLPRRDVLPVALLGLVGFGLYQDLWASALGQTTASNSALITAATPVSTMAIAAAIGSDTITGAKVLGAVMALAGALGVVGVTHGFGFAGASLGDLMTFAATVCWSCYVAIGAPILRRHSPLRMATWAIGFGCLGMLPIALVQLPSFEPSHVHGSTIALFLFCALIAAAASNVVMFEVVKVLGPGRTTLFQSLVPAFAVVAAAVFLSEAIVLGQVIGGLVIFAGVMVSGRASLIRLRRARTAAP
jgi:drug/metabolite transporter (DMT)-like permease